MLTVLPNDEDNMNKLLRNVIAQSDGKKPEVLSKSLSEFTIPGTYIYKFKLVCHNKITGQK